MGTEKSESGQSDPGNSGTRLDYKENNGYNNVTATIYIFYIYLLFQQYAAVNVMSHLVVYLVFSLCCMKGYVSYQPGASFTKVG